MSHANLQVSASWHESNPHNCQGGKVANAMCVCLLGIWGGGFGGPWYFRRSCKRACQQKCSRKAMLCSKQLDVIWECIRALQLHNEPCSLRECTALFKTAANTLRQCTFTPASPFNIWVLHINGKVSQKKTKNKKNPWLLGLYFYLQCHFYNTMAYT